MFKKFLIPIYFLSIFFLTFLIFFINQKIAEKKLQDLMNFGKAQISQFKENKSEVEELKKEISKLQKEIAEIKNKDLENLKSNLEDFEKRIKKISGKAESEKIEEKEPKIDLSFEKEIFSGQEFEVSISVFDLEDGKYDLKISVEKDGKNLSEIYNQKESKWQSSFYYLKELFSGNSFDGKFKLRISKDFEGNADLIVKIRNSETQKIQAQFSDKIEIVKQISSETANQLPIASFTFSPENPGIGQEVLFDASLSKDPDGQISKFIWDFGGNKKETNQSSITHSFLSSGSFIVTLVVLDDLGTSSLPFSTAIDIFPILPQPKEPKISLSFPKEMFLDQEFEVSISLSNLENKSYDLKISIEKDGKILSRIYDPKEGWKSSFYYILNAFSGSNFNGQFKMKVERKEIEEKGFQAPFEANILAKIRESIDKKIILKTSDKITIKE